MPNISNSIDAYLSNTNTDYAILINGAWGIGKTYFIKEKFLDSNNYKPIYISLSNVASPNDLIALMAVSTRLQNHPLNKAQKLCKQISNFAKDNIKLFGETASKFMDSVFQQKVCDYINSFSKPIVVILLDDLERYQGDMHLLFATVHEKFTSNGIHTIYIANEKMIEEKKYNVIKEKYIRYSFEFKEVPEETLISVVNFHTQEGSQFKSFFFDNFNDNVNTIKKWMEKTEITNLRTFMSSIDCYEYIINLVEITENNFKLYLFVSILAHADYVKVAFSTKDQLCKSFDSHLHSRKLQTGDLYNPSFFVLFNNFYVIAKSEAIIEFLTKGFISDIDSFKSTMINKYSIENEYEKAISMLDFLLEDNEIFNLTKKIEQGIKYKKIRYGKLVDLVNMLELIEERDGCDYIAFDYKKIIKEAILNDSYPDKEKFLKEEHNIKIYQNDPPFYNEIKELIISEKKKTKEENEIDGLKTILKDANIKSSEIIKIKADKLFTDIIKFNLWINVKELNKQGLFFVFEDKLGELGEECSPECIKAMKELTRNFQKYLDDTPDMPKSRINQIQRIISKFNQYLLTSDYPGENICSTSLDVKGTPW